MQNINSFNESSIPQDFGANMNNSNSGFSSFGVNSDVDSLPKGLKITAWLIFFISIAFSILLV